MRRETESKPNPESAKAAAKAARLEREAAALRTNLRKRKEQARTLAEAPTKDPDRS